MSYKTVEVELDNGRVVPVGIETLPTRAHALLTLLDGRVPAPSMTCGELAERWRAIEKLPPDEANAFAQDIEQIRAKLPPLKSEWD